MTEQRTGDQASRRRRAFLWAFSGTMVGTAGTAFLFKLYEFYFVASGGAGDALPSFLVPVLTYLVVAAGFACLFLWAYSSGQFRDVEWAKYRMLELQTLVDRHDAVVRRGRE